MPEPAAADAHVVSSENSLTNIVVVCLSREAAQVEENLRASGFSRPSQTEDGTPKQICEKYDAEIEAQKKEIEEQKARIVSYKDWRSDFRLMSDYYTTRADRYRMLGQIPRREKMSWSPRSCTTTLSPGMPKACWSLTDFRSTGGSIPHLSCRSSMLFSSA